MPWEEVAALLEEGFRREGYAVKRLAGAPAGFELGKAGGGALGGARARGGGAAEGAARGRGRARGARVRLCLRRGVDAERPRVRGAERREARGGGGAGEARRARARAAASRFQSLANCFVRPLLLGGVGLDGLGPILGGVVARAGV